MALKRMNLMYQIYPILRNELGIKYYPTTHFLPNGKKIDTGMDEARFEAEISELKHGKKKQEVQAPAPRPAASSGTCSTKKLQTKRSITHYDS